MNYNPAAIQKYFDDLGGAEWERLTSSPLQEINLHIHTHYLKRFVPPKSRVLEIGAGPGRFTEVLHELGCKVVVTDISTVQLDFHKKFAADRNFAGSVESWIQLDISDMTKLDGPAFDVVLAYGGPLSYVFEQSDIAVRECMRVLKDGGLFLASVMSLWGSLHRHFDVIQELPIENIREIVRTGDQTAATEPNTRHYCHIFRAREFRDLLQGRGLSVLAMSASNTLSINHNDLLEKIRRQEDTWSELLAFELEAGAEQGYLDGGTHIIAVTCKAE